MAFFLALDGGGTKTECWVADDTQVLSRLTGPTVKIMNAGEAAATDRLSALVSQALQQAAVSPSSITRTCFGLAGSSSAQVRRWAETALAALVPGELILTGDEEIALEAAFCGGPGVLVIAGTGSNITGRCSDGARVSAGGWGPVLGDEGSGTWIGLEAIRASLRAHDRGIETRLLRDLQQVWAAADLGALVALANRRERPDFAALAQTVARCADAGDALAQGVLDRAGQELAAQVNLVLSKMRSAGCGGDASRVAFTGSVLEHIPRVSRAMREQLQLTAPGLVVDTTAVRPLEGALWRARVSSTQPARLPQPA
ncbi:MAG TPA: BadF/BadG/BcrA/BcrD ATPase family protein [Acidobacteriaceae bacterium]|jgi:N-acetylglucosamine kinase-like BadF-type ATPase|nr:BadF/BadG/BcrA/BcrD ATPase family protein [Acidobacteriaceae bacterium]